MSDKSWASEELLKEIRRHEGKTEGPEPPTPDELNRAHAEYWGKSPNAPPMTPDEVKKEKEDLKERKKKFCEKNPELAREIPDFAWDNTRRYTELARRYAKSFNRKADLVLKLQRRGLANDPDFKKDTEVSTPAREIEEIISADQSTRASSKRSSSETRPTIRNRVIEIMRRERERGISFDEFITRATSSDFWDDDGIQIRDDPAGRRGKFEIICNPWHPDGRKIIKGKRERYDKFNNNLVSEKSKYALDKWWTKAQSKVT